MTTSPQELCLGAHISGDTVMLASEARRRHLYIVGQTGTGKSTLLLNLIVQDLAAGEGLALLDPHGDLAEALLLHIPRARINDLVYLNPADSERPIGFNPLSAVPEDLKPIVADGVVSAFRHVWPESWGPRLDYILTNAVRALLDVPGGTLLMLPRLLIDEPFRVRLVNDHVADPYVRAFWLGEYAGYGDHFRSEAIAPIQNKIGKALIEPRLRNMLAQPKSTITLRRLMDERAIVICNLSKGRLGEGTSHLLGALLTTTIAQAALSRVDIAPAERRTFHLYADEFQSFATDELRADPVGGPQVRADIDRRPPIHRTAARPVAGGGVWQCRFDARPAAPVRRMRRSLPSRSGLAPPTHCSICQTTRHGPDCSKVACRPRRSVLTSSMLRRRGALMRAS